MALSVARQQRSSLQESISGALSQRNRGYGMWSTLRPPATTAIRGSSTKWRIRQSTNHDEERAERARALLLATDIWPGGSLPKPGDTHGYGAADAAPSPYAAAARRQRQRSRPHTS